MTKHTPGPWHVGMKPGPMLYGPKGEQVADLTARLLPEDEITGNARLIAAAPELLAALRSAVAIIESMGADASKGRAAIAKATQSNI